jgi:hypothetical protein
MSTVRAHASLERLENNGLIIRPEIHGDPDFTPGVAHLNLIEERLQGWDPEKRNWGLLQRAFLPIVLRILGPAGRVERMAARDLLPFAEPADAVTTAELAQIASYLEVTVGEAAEKFSELYPSVPVPDLNYGTSSLKIDYEIHGALLSNESEGGRWQISARRIVGAALFLREPLGDFLGRLDPFRMLGAPVPAYDESVRVTLDAIRLDEHDETMLLELDEFGEDRDLDTISPLSLIRIAGRLGWTLAHAHWRLGRLIPIGVELEYPADANLPDEIVYWYDPLVLTKYFDGQEPVISGRIDWPYLENAAVEIFDCPPEETSEKAAFLRDRLRLYAPLFQLELPEDRSLPQA